MLDLPDLNCSVWLPVALCFPDFTPGVAGTGAFLWLVKFQVLMMVCCRCDLVTQLGLHTGLLRLREKCSFSTLVHSLAASSYCSDDVWKELWGPSSIGRAFYDASNYCCLNQLEDTGRNALRRYKRKNRGRIRACEILASLHLKHKLARQW